MNDRPIHNLYLHFQELPISRRILYTGALLVLGMGYLFALLYVYTAHSGRDGEPGVSVQDIIITYSGTSEGTKLGSALQGPMSGMLPQEDLATMLRWIREGAEKGPYESTIKPIIEANCLSCHDGGNPHLSNLDGFENVEHVIEQDTGADMFTLVRVSHIHLFGLTFIFFIVGFIFSHAYVHPIWFKCAVMAIPFGCIVVDVSSWYITKVFNPFGWAVLIAGGFMGLSFAYMWVISMYQMWLYKLPEELRDRGGQREKLFG
jgi:hypothetical protein